MAEINLALLPAPNVLEDISFEQILAEMKDAAIAIMPELAPVLALESEPATKVLQVCATFVMLTRARVNDAAKAVMVAYSTGADLEQLAALYGVTRLLITPANPSAIPPTEAVYEGDEALRARIVMAPEAFSSAGPVAGYEFHALSASGQVRDVSVTTPTPGVVRVVVQSTAIGGGVPSSELLDTVDAALNAETVRPICDDVSVLPVSVINYTVTATIEVMPGPDPAVVLSLAKDALDAYVEQCNRIGRAVRLSGIYAALHQQSVIQVNLSAPVADIVPSGLQTAYCSAATVTLVTP